MVLHGENSGRSAASSDLDLIRAALGGDRESADSLAERLRVIPRILAIVNGRKGSRLDHHALEDLAQDVLILVWSKLDQFDVNGNLEGWVYRFCTYEYMNRVARKRLAPLPESLDPPAEEERTLDPMDVEVLEDALQKLGPPEEIILRMRHQDGLSFREIGAHLGLSQNTAKTRYYRGIRWLRLRLKDPLGREQ